MTCREKAMIEHRSMDCCPSGYGYLDNPDFCWNDGNLTCDRCWDREIPEKDRQFSESKYKTICDRCYSSGICKYSDDLNIFMHDVHNRFPFVTPDFKCEYFNDRKENV